MGAVLMESPSLSDRVKLDTPGYQAAKAHLDLMYVLWVPLA